MLTAGKLAGILSSVYKTSHLCKSAPNFPAVLTSTQHQGILRSNLRLSVTSAKIKPNIAPLQCYYVIKTGNRLVSSTAITVV